MSSIRVVLVATGDEITNGDILDGNGAWLAERLFSVGVPPWSLEALPDDPQRLVEAMERLANGADIAVFCGGLGPTDDDHTVDAVANWLGTQPEHHAPTLERARQLFSKRGMPFVPNSARQCRIPAGTEICPNPVGLAPAFWVQRGRCRLFFLPGPPAEFRACCEACVLPFAQELARLAGAPAAAFRRFRTTELGESILADMVALLVKANPDVRFGWRATYPEVWFKVLVTHNDPVQAHQRLELIDAQVRLALGENLFGTDEETIEGLVGLLLKRNGLTVATAESCTGGLLGSIITSVPGSSGWYVGGVVTYSNQLKTRLLGVPESLLSTHGAVSEECAIAMAEGARRSLGSDLAVAITGIAGPDGGSAQKPVGTIFVALATPSGTFVQRPSLRPPRERIRLGAAWFALNMVRKYLLSKETTTA